MNTPAAYICSHCLRASRRTLPQRLAANASRSIHSRPSARLSTARNSIATSARSTKPIQQTIRSLSTASPLLKPSLESHQQPSAQPTPPPPAPPTKPEDYTTATLLNPRTNEETGQPMAISITPRATRRLEQIMLKDKNPHLCLRVTVESGGCHGFQYLMSLVDASKVDESEDVLFVASSNADPSIVSGGEGGGQWRRVAEGRPKVVIDESSLELLQGSRVDYTMELIGSQFKIDNPRASSSCGCGTSFDVKI